MYLAHSLMKAANCVQEPYGQPMRVVGVVGMGHVTGIKSRWLSEECKDVRELLRIPQPHWSSVAFWAYVGWGLQAVLTFGSIWVCKKVVKSVGRSSIYLLDYVKPLAHVQMAH